MGLQQELEMLLTTVHPPRKIFLFGWGEKMCYFGDGEHADDCDCVMLLLLMAVVIMEMMLLLVIMVF